MQNVPQDTGVDDSKLEKAKHGTENVSSTPQSTNSTPTKSETETYSENRRFMSETSESEEDSVSEVGLLRDLIEFGVTRASELLRAMVSMNLWPRDILCLVNCSSIDLILVGFCGDFVSDTLNLYKT